MPELLVEGFGLGETVTVSVPTNNFQPAQKLAVTSPSSTIPAAVPIVKGTGVKSKIDAPESVDTDEDLLSMADSLFNS